jgi:putative addiction module component (TIGR02574 family)
MMSQTLPDAAAELLRIPMTTEQRLELIGRLWDAIPDSAEALPVPDWHQQILRERLAAADANPETAISWDEVEKGLRDE